MAGFSNFLEDSVLNHVLRGVAMPTLTSIYVGLYTAAPTDAGGGTEVTGGAYARVAVTRATGSWAVPSDVSGAETTSNAATIVFPSPTANWGTVTHVGLFDAATAGNLLMWAALGTSRNILNGDVAPQFAIGALTVSLD
jgi:hypothetical protein